MKKCPICGVEIINGVNGCSMYETCTTCKPIYYPRAVTKQGHITSWSDLDENENRCLGKSE